MRKVDMDKAGKELWDDLWSDNPLPRAWDPGVRSGMQYVPWQFHRYFERLFAPEGAARGKRLLEVGCAGSASLPYFAKQFGFEVSGLDYSEVGCRRARAVLEREGVQGEVVCADLFDPPNELIGSFDVVVSFGVAEHFQDTAGCITALARFLRPGGTLFTNIPNMTGANGRLQKFLYRPLFETHVLLDREALASAHRAAGLRVSSCEYFLSTNFGVCNLTGLDRKDASWLPRKVVLALMARVSVAVWSIERITGEWKATMRFSPYINCVAQKA